MFINTGPLNRSTLEKTWGYTPVSLTSKYLINLTIGSALWNEDLSLELQSIQSSTASCALPTTLMGTNIENKTGRMNTLRDLSNCPIQHETDEHFSLTKREMIPIVLLWWHDTSLLNRHDCTGPWVTMEIHLKLFFKSLKCAVGILFF